MGKFIGTVAAGLVGFILARTVGSDIVERVNASGVVDTGGDSIVAAEWPHLLSQAWGWTCLALWASAAVLTWRAARHEYRLRNIHWIDRPNVPPVAPAIIVSMIAVLALGITGSSPRLVFDFLVHERVGFVLVGLTLLGAAAGVLGHFSTERFRAREAEREARLRLPP